ncbi:MAG: hypothetical protein WCI06_06065 [Methylococcaceae bacterium]
MTTLTELEMFITELPEREVWQLSNWLQNYVSNLLTQSKTTITPQSDLRGIKELFKQAKNQIIDPTINIDALTNEMME